MSLLSGAIGSARDTAESNSQFPDSPSEEIPFAIYTNESGKSDFTPYYYPSRFSVTTEKEFERTAAACAGERISIKELKNSELHINGKIHAFDLSSLDQLTYTTEPVELISPIVKSGGMEAYVKSVERGELVGYDSYPTADDWLFEYTIDLVSSGRDEYSEDIESRYKP